MITMLFLQHSNYAQQCTYSIYGQITDDATHLPLPGATITLKEVSKSTITNERGYFELSQICKGEYHIIVSHIGCEDIEQAIDFKNNKEIDIEMPHLINRLDGVHLAQKSHEVTTQNLQVVKARAIQKKANKSLAHQLEGLLGVTTLNNGNSIAKPVVNGLYGSRVMILNNNIVQSGQQWGSDHAPEIDPLTAGSIEVVKGVAALEYQGSGLGAVINVIPRTIKKDAHIHGSLTYLAERNGLGNNANYSLQQKKNKFGWEISGTLKKYGDAKTPKYYLNNTGYTEMNTALQLEYNFSDQWQSKWYISSFNTNLGILRGAHVTLNDSDYAKAILNADQPQYTETDFSYAIDAPRQEVHHHLLKWKNIVNINKDEKYEFVYSGQLDTREEYDIRRADRSDIPALGLFQQNHFIEIKHYKLHQHDLTEKKGLQYTFTDNTNDPDTGILPLIPDYLSHQLGGFVLFDKEKENWKFELGARYNFTYQSVAYINRNEERNVENYTNYFQNYSVAGGANYVTSKYFDWSLNLGLTSRNPDINELYAYGLHQGVSGFEIGNVNLKKETGIKSTLGLKGSALQKWFFEGMMYINYIDNFIYLQPQNKFIKTIRGTFALFEYLQTDASLVGLDFGANYLFSDELSFGAKYSFLRGHNVSKNIPLVSMPANHAALTINYKSSQGGFLKNSSVGFEYRYRWKQHHLLDWQDIKPAPSAYQLLNFDFEKQIYVYHTHVKLYGSIDNMFNVTYRDYLDRMRYFSDHLGRSMTIGFCVKF